MNYNCPFTKTVCDPEGCALYNPLYEKCDLAVIAYANAQLAELPTAETQMKNIAHAAGLRETDWHDLTDPDEQRKCYKAAIKKHTDKALESYKRYLKEGYDRR